MHSIYDLVLLAVSKRLQVLAEFVHDLQEMNRVNRAR
jgi:hypothetical protein